MNRLKKYILQLDQQSPDNKAMSIGNVASGLDPEKLEQN